MIQYSQEQILQLLDDKMVLYKDLETISSTENHEEFALLSESMSSSGRLLIYQASLDEHDVTQFIHTKELWFRRQVVGKLLEICTLLEQKNTNYKLKLVYGYRSLKTQTALFEHFKSKLSTQYSGDTLLEEVHKNIAVPSVSGHPTGGAVDLCLTDLDGNDLDYGTTIWEFGKFSYTFNPFINREAWYNRQYLRRLMMDRNFAPFDGEWWHFSYGDKEWAYYYEKPQSLYTQKEIPTKN